jgi:hypothetical protein
MGQQLPSQWAASAPTSDQILAVENGLKQVYKWWLQSEIPWRPYSNHIGIGKISLTSHG